MGFELVKVTLRQYSKGQIREWNPDSFGIVSNFFDDVPEQETSALLNYRNHPNYKIPIWPVKVPEGQPLAYAGIYRRVETGKIEAYKVPLEDHEPIPEWSILPHWPKTEQDIGSGKTLYMTMPDDWWGLNFEPIEREGLHYEIENVGQADTFEGYAEDLLSDGRILLSKLKEIDKDVQEIEFLTVWNYIGGKRDYWSEWEYCGVLDHNRLGDVVYKSRELTTEVPSAVKLQ